MTTDDRDREQADRRAGFLAYLKKYAAGLGLTEQQIAPCHGDSHALARLIYETERGRLPNPRTTTHAGGWCDICGGDLYEGEFEVITEAGATVCLDCTGNADLHDVLYPQCTDPGCGVFDHDHNIGRVRYRRPAAPVSDEPPF